MARIGETTCGNPACGCKDVALHRTAGGKLSAKCHKCGCELWAPQGTRAHRQILGAAVLDAEDAAPDDAHEAAPEAASKPAPARRGAFDLGAL